MKKRFDLNHDCEFLTLKDHKLMYRSHGLFSDTNLLNQLIHFRMSEEQDLVMLMSDLKYTQFPNMNFPRPFKKRGK